MRFLHFTVFACILTFSAGALGDSPQKTGPAASSGGSKKGTPSSGNKKTGGKTPAKKDEKPPASK